MEGVFATINRKNIFLGRAQIFPGQGTIFLSGGGVNANLLVSIKFTKVQTEGGVRECRVSSSHCLIRTIHVYLYR